MTKKQKIDRIKSKIDHCQEEISLLRADLMKINSPAVLAVVLNMIRKKEGKRNRLFQEKDFLQGM